MVRLLVCGSRTWADAPRVGREIGLIAPSEVIHGAAPGADTMAASEAVGWACALGHALIVRPFPADWKRDGNSAGPRRNARMLAEGKPDRGLAFGALYREADNRGGGARNTGAPRTGTGDMVRRMLAAGLPVRWIATSDAPAIDLVAMPEPPR